MTTSLSIEAPIAHELFAGPPLGAATVAVAFQRCVRQHAEQPALRTAGRDDDLTWADYGRLVEQTATGIDSLGVIRGDIVGLLMGSRIEFHIIDAAAMSLGAATCSLYETYSREQLAHIIDQAGCRVLFTDRERHETARELQRTRPHLMVICVDDDAPGDPIRPTLRWLRTQRRPGFDFASRVAAVRSDDVLTLIYTSGTTGEPKGVELTHDAVLTLGRAFLRTVALPERSRVISHLPMAHVAERCATHWLPMALGMAVTVCPDIRQMGTVVTQVRPQWLFSVPRYWEKVKAGVEAVLPMLPDETRVPALRALRVGGERFDRRLANLPPDPALDAEHAELDAGVLADARRLLGMDELLVAQVGAAPTPLPVLRFFYSLGVGLGEIWGMSELCGVACVNRPEQDLPGSVGRPLPGVELRIADDGEVHVRARSSMRGYRAVPEDGSVVVDDEGWLSTGDLGRLTDRGELVLRGRKKELIVTAYGKNIAPSLLEATVRAEAQCVAQVCCVGEGRPYVAALVVLEPDSARALLARHDVAGAESLEVADLAAHPVIRAELARAVEHANTRLSHAEQVKQFTILPEAWAPGDAALTPTMKLRREAISDRYRSEIEDLYRNHGQEG